MHSKDVHLFTRASLNTTSFMFISVTQTSPAGEEAGFISMEIPSTTTCTYLAMNDSKTCEKMMPK